MPNNRFEFSITTNGYEELINNLDEAPEIVLMHLNRALHRTGKLLVPPLREATPVGAKGDLRKSTTAQVIGGTGSDMRLEIRQAAKSSKGYFYGGAVRGGTPPHFPPYRELIPWVIKKLGVASEMAPQVAFLIARKISKVGTKPNPYHLRVVEENMGGIQNIVNEEGQEIAAQLAQL